MVYFQQAWFSTQEGFPTGSSPPLLSCEEWLEVAVMTLPTGNAAEHSEQFNELPAPHRELRSSSPKLAGRGKHGVQSAAPPGPSAPAVTQQHWGCCMRALRLC